MILKPCAEVFFGTKLESIRNRLLKEFESLAITAAGNEEAEFVLQIKNSESLFESFLVDSAVSANYTFGGCQQSTESSDLYLYFSFSN